MIWGDIEFSVIGSSLHVINDKEIVATAAKFVEEAVLQRDSEKFYKVVITLCHLIY